MDRLQARGGGGGDGGGSGETIWYRDARAFMLAPGAAARIVPRPEDALEAQLNAVMRLALYAALAVALLHRSLAAPTAIVAAAAAGTWAVHALGRGGPEAAAAQQRERLMQELQLERDPRTGEACTRPTLDNPYMNVLLSDYRRFPERPQACDLTLDDVAERADRLGAHNLYVDADDVYGGSSSAFAARPFYATAFTTIPNDQTGFARWLYSPSPHGRGTCREGDGDMCAARVFHHRPGL